MQLLIRSNIKKGPTLNNYLKEVILYHCAPTIIGIKPASLINFTQTNRLYWPWRRYSIKFNDSPTYSKLGHNISFYEIHHQLGCQTLVLFYNPELLSESLLCQDNRQFLTALGYKPTHSTTDYLKLLAQRFNATCPHEVGIFLGIPICDVSGFIENKGKNYIFNQYWKVYQNPQRTKKIFAAYDRAKMELIQKLKIT